MRGPARALAQDALGHADPVGWFDHLHREAEAGQAMVSLAWTQLGVFRQTPKGVGASHPLYGAPSASAKSSFWFDGTPTSTGKRMVDTQIQKGLAKGTRGAERSLRVQLNRDDLLDLPSVRGVDPSPCDP